MHRGPYNINVNLGMCGLSRLHYDFHSKISKANLLFNNSLYRSSTSVACAVLIFRLVDVARRTAEEINESTVSDFFALVFRFGFIITGSEDEKNIIKLIWKKHSKYKKRSKN